MVLIVDNLLDRKCSVRLIVNCEKMKAEWPVLCRGNKVNSLSKEKTQTFKANIWYIEEMIKNKMAKVPLYIRNIKVQFSGTKKVDVLEFYGNDSNCTMSY